MKRCPDCRRDYADETLLYCLDDGTALVEGPAEEPTRLFSAEGQKDYAATARFASSAPASEPPIRREVAPSEDGFSTGTDVSQSNPTDARQRSSSLIAGAIGLVLIAAVAIGFYL